MRYHNSITVELDSELYKFVDENCGKLSYSKYIESLIRKEMNEKQKR